MCLYYFFFFKQTTAYEMRISDWSSACALPILRRHDPVNDRQTKPGAVGAGMVRPAMPPHKFAKPIGRQALSAVTHPDHRIWANPYGHRAHGWPHPDSIFVSVPQGGGARFAPAPRHGMPPP